MAYAGVISLAQTIHDLILNSHRISTVPDSFSDMIDSLFEEVHSVEEALEELDGTHSRTDTLTALDTQIREAVFEFEDILESHILSNHQEIHGDQDIDSFVQMLIKMKESYIHELHNQSPEPDDVPSRADFESSSSETVVGLSDLFIEIKDRIATGSAQMSISLVGMAGIGKTTLSNKLVTDPLISSRCSRRAFVTVGPKYRLPRVLLDVLKQVNPEFDQTLMLMEDEQHCLEGLKKMVRRSLEDRGYIIVLDDVWDVMLGHNVEDLFPWARGGRLVLVTTRLEEVAKQLDYRYVVRFLDKKESWDLLREKVFGDKEMSCPLELVKAGKKIAENCQGLPLTIVIVAGILSQAEKTTEYWNRVAADKNSPVFLDAYDRMYEVLYPSYDYLDQRLKPCFLYMGAFPQNYEIPHSKLVNLWIAEGFPKPYWYPFPYDDFDWECLRCLSDNSVIVVHNKSHINAIKTCSLHSSFWHLSNKEASKNKFLHGLNSLADGLSEEGLRSQRRLCIRNNVLFAIKDVYDSIASISTVRSLLCTGPYHRYPVPICSVLRSLRVLDAITIRFYEFPIEVVKLVNLRYLALTCDRKLPASISKLWNLHFLIVHRHFSIIKLDESSYYLPMEIWDMQELRHLQVTGSNLPHPGEDSFLLNLVTLLDVSSRSCAREILERMPCLQKLGIRIESRVEPLCFSDHVSCLDKLERLKCVVVNPRIMAEVVPLSILPSNLVKLTLSGCGFPWNEMSKISALPSLRFLKLRCYAFRGPKWEVHENEFEKLEFLLIEDSDLQRMTLCGDGLCLHRLELLSIRNCYRLEEIPLKFGECETKIELVDCNPLPLSFANKLKEIRNEKYYFRHPLVLHVHSSWDI